jgi:hypothetical protein
VPARALACPECGADHNSGWGDDAGVYDGAALPDQEFNYDEFVKAEFGRSAKPAGIKTLWWIVGIILIVAFVRLYFF